MSGGRKTLAEACSLAAEVTARLRAAGVPDSRMPPHDAVLASVWPVARKIVRRRKRAAVAAQWAMYEEQRAAEAAQAAGGDVDRLAACWEQAAGRELRRLVDFRPGDWHLALVPCPASADDLRKEAA